LICKLDKPERISIYASRKAIEVIVQGWNKKLHLVVELFNCTTLCKFKRECFQWRQLEKLF